ncbi:MAG: PD-(D/E)XK nuclease family protein [Desulfuromonadales bacterium]|nr:PD-(D/E)XK nuclease family protein [Desulfuromonadales bacterium]
MNPMKQTELLKYLQNNIPVVAVNRRLARRLIADFDALQVAQGGEVWRRPEVFTYETWLKNSLQKLDQADALLSPAQAQRVWEKILSDDIKTAGTSLLQVTQSAKMALAASQLLTRYETTFSEEEGAVDHCSFLRWQNVWMQMAGQNGWIMMSELPGLVADALDRGRLTAPGKLLFAGFDNLTPIDLRLRRSLQQRNCQLIDWQIPERKSGSPGLVAAASPDDEVRRAACWASAILQADPDCRVAIVAPQLEQYRSSFQSTFLAQIDPSLLINGELHSKRMNISLGERLDRIPVVRTGLKLLSTGHQISLNEIGWLLRSPYLKGSLTEQSQRCLADRVLREKNRTDWTLPRLLKRLEPLKIPDFCAIVSSFIQRPAGRGTCSPGAWAEKFHEEIGVTGWPGERTLSSDDYQAVKRFYQTLESLASLDRVCGLIDRSTAVKLLSQLAAEAIFQPESQSNGVDVLGLLEAAGQEFDHLWVLGLHDAALPQPAQPNPFIPLPLQRRLEMPHADADRELFFARTVTRRLFCAAPDLVLSWPQTIDGAPCRPSPLIHKYTPSEPPQATSADPASIIWQQRPELESVDDRHVAPIHSQKAVSGGTGIVKDQAICPFRAFAHHRLRAEGLRSPDVGLDGMARGTLIHTVLELFWQEVVAQKRLLAMSEESLLTLLKTVVEQAISRFERQYRDSLTPRQRRLESARLLRMALKWLEVDRRRPPFEAVVEQRHTKMVGQLTLRTRIDRLDTLENGHIAIIDFKSGSSVDHKQWLDARITEPQLPIYCLHHPADSIDAVLFAHLQGNDKECRFVGLARTPDAWPGLQESSQNKLLADKGVDDFDAALRHWQKVLPELGDAFIRGEIAVTPVQEKSCQYCDIKPICRIDMTAAGGGDEL